MNALTKTESTALAPISESELMKVLQSSLYPGAAEQSIKMVLGYCKATGLDPMQKPVHIVPMWDSKAGAMRDVVMPGVNLYRTQAMRSGECAGVSEPEFGPDITERIGGQEITFPAWCRVTVKRRLPTGEIVDFAAREFWRENYAVKGGKEKSVAPNAMWTKRPFGQIAKCAEAQALRKAFPEIASQPTADEMEGKPMQVEDQAAPENRQNASIELINKARIAADGGRDNFAAWWKACTPDERASLRDQMEDLKARTERADQGRTVEAAPPAAAPAAPATKTFDEVMAMLCAAKTEDALFVAGEWIEAITEDDGRAVLQDKFDERLGQVQGAAA